MKTSYQNIVLIGMPGSGKTTIGKKLSLELGIGFYDSDEYIEEITGKSISEIFLSGEELFRSIETDAIKEIASKTPFVVATGGGVVKNMGNIKALKNDGVVVFINRPIENIASDIDAEKRPLLKNKKENLYKLYHERIELYKKYCDYEIINDRTIDDAVANIVSTIK